MVESEVRRVVTETEKYEKSCKTHVPTLAHNRLRKNGGQC